MILLIDNYDSFTFNLYQYIGTFTEEIAVVRNDQITIEEIRQRKPDRIYGLTFAGFDIRFQVKDDILTVVEVTKV